MNIWLMQIHPDDSSKSESWAMTALSHLFIALDIDENLDPTGGKSFLNWSYEDFEKCKSLHKEELGTERVSSSIEKFYFDVQQNDLVLIKAGKKPLALAQAKDYYFEPYPQEIDFRHRRRIELLSWYESFKYRFPNFELNLPAPKTLMRLDDRERNNFKAILSWYNYIKEEYYMHNFLYILNMEKQIILSGPPGTGKTYNAQKLAISQASGQIFTEDPKPKFEELRKQGQVEIVQFHPSYNYEDFVRGIQVSTDTAGNIVYTTQNRILGEMAKKARNSNDNNYVLIIDEINRANLAAVLGELIYALEYRKEPVRTPYASDGDHTINIPDNLYIIGTMNTADRSVGHIDYAVRRRFAFIPCLPGKNALETYYNNSSNNPSLKDFAMIMFDSVAGIFDKTYWGHTGYLAPDFFKDDVQVGHTYFMAKSCEELAVKFAYQVYPLLREYYKDGILIPGNDGKIIHYLGRDKGFSCRVDEPEDSYELFKKILSKCEEGVN